MFTDNRKIFYFFAISTPGSSISQLPFSTRRSALVWSIVILFILFFVNSHIILNGYYDPAELINSAISRVENGSIVNFSETKWYQNPNFHRYKYSSKFSLSPWWDIVHMYIYTIAPFIIMLSFNSLLIYATISKRLSLTKESSKSQQRKRNLTISLLVVTFSFLIMTVPSTIAFGYLYEYLISLSYGRTIANALDVLSFLNHSSLFMTCYISNVKFRQIIIKKY